MSSLIPKTQPRLQFLLLLSLTCFLVACQNAPQLSNEQSNQLLFQLLETDSAVAQAALTQIEASQDIRFAPALIDLYWAGRVGLNDWSYSGDLIATLEAISGETFGDDWAAWVIWYSQAEIEPHSAYVAWKGALFGQIDAEFADFFVGPIADAFRPGEIVFGGVAVDGIPALDNSEQVAAEQGDTFPREAVFGVSINGDSRAYPLRIMDWHEMANDVIGGVPVSIAYCTLCGSAIAYEARLDDGTPVDFGSSGLLYRSNKLMYDRQTRSLWNQLTGEPVMGEAVERVDRLELIPIVLTTWGEWLAMHPDSTILTENTGHIREYMSGAAYGSYYVDDETLFPVAFDASTLAAKAQIYGMNVNGAAIAYPIESLLEANVLNHVVNRQNIVLVAADSIVRVHGYSYQDGDISYSAGAQVRAYERGNYQFRPGAQPDQLIDQNDQVWQISENELLRDAGTSLKRLNGHLSFWFAWSAFNPDTSVYVARE